MNLKAQDTSYDPRNEKTDTNRNAADVELINSSVQDIPEAVRWPIFEPFIASLLFFSEKSVSLHLNLSYNGYNVKPLGLSEK